MTGIKTLKSKSVPKIIAPATLLLFFVNLFKASLKKVVGFVLNFVS